MIHPPGAVLLCGLVCRVCAMNNSSGELVLKSAQWHARSKVPRRSSSAKFFRLIWRIVSSKQSPIQITPKSQQMRKDPLELLRVHFPDAPAHIATLPRWMYHPSSNSQHLDTMLVKRSLHPTFPLDNHRRYIEILTDVNADVEHF